jgi:hypothetical protein
MDGSILASDYYVTRLSLDDLDDIWGEKNRLRLRPDISFTIPNSLRRWS